MKRKFFGMNAARVYALDVPKLRASALEETRGEYAKRPNPSFATYGPTNRRQFLALQAAEGGRPG
jgi:hypothetical protein